MSKSLLVVNHSNRHIKYLIKGNADSFDNDKINLNIIQYRMKTI